MASVPELVYFDGRGLAEIDRIVMTAAGLTYNEIDLTSREQFLALFPELLFLQVPLLRIDGLKIVQSGSIARYIAGKANLLGTNDKEHLLVDQLYEGARECYMPMAGIGFYNDAEIMPRCTKNLDKYLPIFDKVASDNGSGYLVGSSLTLADLAVFEVLEASRDFFGKDNFQAHPGLVKFYTTVTALPNIQKYLKEIRKPINTPAYVENVKKVLLMP